MLQPVDRYNLVPYDRLSTRPWCGQEEGQMQEDDPRFAPLMENVYGLGVEAAKVLLRSEIELSDAPYSKMNTACVIETERPSPTNPYGYNEMHTGHRTEFLNDPSGLNVVTAVEMALSKITKDETICGVYLTGRDLPDGKLKRHMPLPTDYDHISARFSQDWGPPFFIIPAESYDYPGLKGVKWVLQNKHVKAYAQHDRIVLSDLADDEEPHVRRDYTRDQLRLSTNLTPKDREFVVDFTEAAILNRWTAFFTGSASGLGEITPAITDAYDDMDFIVAADQPDKAEASIIALAESHYGPLLKVPELAYDTYRGKKIGGFFLYDHVGNKRVQVTIGKTMDKVCFRPDVLARNSGIWMNDCRDMQCESHTPVTS